MVFFTCNACGQSVKKNKVEKHWQTECPKCEVLSCMDCGQDFYGDEYIAHNSCITEAEKYQGALFKGEKGGKSKGEKKQQEWLEQVLSRVSTGGHPPRINQLIQQIMDYSNVPRKKAKFENFVRNSLNVRDRGTLDALWEIINVSKMEETEKEKEEKKETEDENHEMNHKEEEKSKDEKKKKKKRDGKEETCEIIASEEVIKKKKKKKRSLEIDEGGPVEKKLKENDDIIIQSDENKTISKKHKKTSNKLKK